MSVETKETPMTTENAREIAAHLGALMNNPATPETIKQDLENRIKEMQKEANCGEPSEVHNALRIHDTHFSRDYSEQEESTLPSLISMVLNHPHVTNGVYDALSEVLGEGLDGDSPEFIAAALGLKVKPETHKGEK